jgi:SAM-dependent methyltransferase
VIVAVSLVYRNALIYELVLLGLYGRHYGGRYRSVADLIPVGSSVLELCCGPGVLFDRYLRARSVDYTGIDVNPRFVARVNRLGGRGVLDDLGDGRPLPDADTVLMQASLYQFLPDPGPIVRRMLRAARQQVILAEPVRNLATSHHAWLAALARRQTDPGLGARAARFTEASFDAFIAGLGERITRSYLIPGGREKVAVLDPRGGSPC